MREKNLDPANGHETNWIRNTAYTKIMNFDGLSPIYRFKVPDKKANRLYASNNTKKKTLNCNQLVGVKHIKYAVQCTYYTQL